MMKQTILPLLIATSISVAEPQQPIEPQLSAPNYPITSIRRFADSFEAVRRHYVEDISDEALFNLAIHGMLEGLDPHSAFLEPEDFLELKERTSGEFVGLGLEVDMEDGLVKVVSPIDGSPAAKAGVRSGDLILRLDETPVRGLSLTQAIDRMRGELGTEIMLTIIRDGQSKPLKLTLERDTIQTASVRSEWLASGIAYIRIASFETDTGDEVRKHITELAAETIQGLVIDLRNNPGGSLEAAIAVSDAFLDAGLVVYTRGRHQDDRKDYNATEGDLINSANIIVLINEGSASASEIVAGALQDRKRAIILGSRSFGKGSVQQVMPLTEEYGIKLTTALYFTPNGRSIQAQGIIPDINTPLAEVKALRYESITEKALPSHLELQEGETVTSEPEAEPKRDNQLTEAIHILKAMQLTPAKKQ